MISPNRVLKENPILAQSLRCLLIALSFWAASVCLGWHPNSAAFAAPLVGCSILGVAHLFSGLLLTSDCTAKVGGLWSVGAILPSLAIIALA